MGDLFEHEAPELTKKREEFVDVARQMKEDYGIEAIPAATKSDFIDALVGNVQLAERGGKRLYGVDQGYTSLADQLVSLAKEYRNGSPPSCLSLSGN